jgi:hypothetical protein
MGKFEESVSFEIAAMRGVKNALLMVKLTGSERIWLRTPPLQD